MSRRPCLLLGAILAFGCNVPDQPARLAVAGPLTGELAADGQSIERAVRLAVEEEAARGGRPRVEVVSFDDKADPAEALAAARRAIDDPAVFAVIGHLTSGCAIEASRLYAQAGLPMITPSATAPELTLQQERPDWSGERVIFRLPPSDAVQGEVAAGYAARRLGLKRVAVVHDATPYGLGLARAFRDSYLRKGGIMTRFEGAARGTRDFMPLLRPLLREKPDGLFFGGSYTDAAPLIKQARAAGFHGAFLSGDGVKSPEFFEAAGAASDGAYLTVGGVPLESMPGAADFMEQFQKRWSAPPRTFDLYAYEAARVALGAMRKVGTDRRKVVEAIRGGSVRGMIGDIVFDGKGDTLKALVTMTKADYQHRRFEVFY